MDSNKDIIPLEHVSLNHTIAVDKLDKFKLFDMRKNPPKDSVNVEMECWQETDGTVPVINMGGGPCLIIYAHDSKTDRLISGHFPLFLDSRVSLLKSGPQIDDPNFYNGYENYKKMEERFKELGLTNLELFLFGNHTMMENKGGKKELLFQLERLGVPSLKIHDFRTDDTKQFDDTYYSPEDRKIYYNSWTAKEVLETHNTSH